MLTSMILGILTIVLALAFSLLHLAAAFSAMKQKDYSLGNKCILVGSCLTSLALAILYFVPLATILLWIVGSSMSAMEPTGTGNRKKVNIYRTTSFV